jgi:hypothetical protein
MVILFIVAQLVWFSLPVLSFPSEIICIIDGRTYLPPHGAYLLFISHYSEWSWWVGHANEPVP